MDRIDTAQSAEPATQRARELLSTMGEILGKYGEQEIADLAQFRASGTTQTRSAVVVGEVKRGKSYLVNALVGRRDASPVGVEVTTATTLAVGPASQTHPDGVVTLWFPGHTEQIPHAELAGWVTRYGQHVVDPAVDALPTRAHVPVRDSSMGDLIVVDTPGVGGLDPSFAGLAASNAEQGRVLVVVCDATTPITAPEMEFIRRTGGGVEALIVAVTKTDKNLRRWRPIVEQNRALLREHIGRDIPVVGVSSLRAVTAAEMPPGPERDREEEESGIAQLRREITSRMATAENLPLANGLRTAAEPVKMLAGREADTASALTDTVRALPELTAKVAQLERLRADTNQWELHLQRDLTMIRQHATAELDRRLAQLREEWTTRIGKSGMAVLRRDPQYFTARMENDYREAIAASVSVFVAEVHSRIVHPRFSSEVVWEEIRTILESGLAGSELTTHKVASKTDNVLDPSMITMGVVGSTAIAGIVGVSTLMGVGAVVGVAWVGVNLGHRIMRSGKTNLLQWMRETSSATKTATARRFEAAIAQARPEIVIRYRDHLKTSIAELQSQIAQAQEADRVDTAERNKTIERHQKNSAILTKYATLAEELIGELAGVPAQEHAL
ncbi:hypothetical protein G6016_01375 [Dietzia aerolata]|uniref:dynamin family protein n=1 Tax=Dietzia aerolata TaxID=595984 RepID=UPI0015FD5EF5|nr:hypothetical protein [Dietzia aerolata]